MLVRRRGSDDREASGRRNNVQLLLVGSTAGVSYLILQTKTAVEGGNEKELGKEVTVVDGLASQTQAI